MKTECPHCKQHYDVDRQYLNIVAECQNCKKEFVIKELNEHSEDAPANDYVDPATLLKQSCLNNEQDRSNENLQTSVPAKVIKKHRKASWIIGIFVILIFCAGTYYYNYSENLNCSKDWERHNKDIMREALLSLAKYPGSSEVVFKYYREFPNADFIVADGYIDMPNGFGVKSRFEFSFHVKEFVTRKPFFFSLFGGQKYITDKKNLGQICLKDHQGKFHFIQSEERWK